MQGTILDFSIQSNAGAISGDDGNRYTFNGAEWKESRPPTRGTIVDFAIEDGQAKSIYKSVRAIRAEDKSKVTAGLLALLLGGIGAHKFYLGHTGLGVLFLLTNTVGFLITWLVLFLPNIVLGLIAFIEGIIYFTRSDEKFEEIYVVGKKKWF